MPTSRPRHTITETPHVKEALDEVRAKLPEGEQIDYAELIMLGAEVKARRLDVEESSSRACRKRLAEMIRTASFPYEVDIDAADAVKRLKLAPKYE